MESNSLYNHTSNQPNWTAMCQMSNLVPCKFNITDRFDRQNYTCNNWFFFHSLIAWCLEFKKWLIKIIKIKISPLILCLFRKHTDKMMRSASLNLSYNQSSLRTSVQQAIRMFISYVTSTWKIRKKLARFYSVHKSIISY